MIDNSAAEAIFLALVCLLGDAATAGTQERGGRLRDLRHVRQAQSVSDHQGNQLYIQGAWDVGAVF